MWFTVPAIFFPEVSLLSLALSLTHSLSLLLILSLSLSYYDFILGERPLVFDRSSLSINGILMISFVLSPSFSIHKGEGGPSLCLLILIPCLVIFSRTLRESEPDPMRTLFHVWVHRSILAFVLTFALFYACGLSRLGLLIFGLSFDHLALSLSLWMSGFSSLDYILIISLSLSLC